MNPFFQLTENLTDDNSNLLYKGLAIPTVIDLGLVYFVSVNGDNTTAIRGRWDRPFKTIQVAINAIPDSNPGHLIMIMPGAYTENVTLTIDRSPVLHFSNGATLNGNITTTSAGGGSRFEICGYGTILGNLTGNGNGSQFHIRDMKRVGSVTTTTSIATEVSLLNVDRVGDIVGPWQFVKARNVEQMGGVQGVNIQLTNVKRVMGRVEPNYANNIFLTAINTHFYRSSGANIWWNDRNTGQRLITLKGCALTSQNDHCIHAPDTHTNLIGLVDCMLHSGPGKEAVWIDTSINTVNHLNIQNVRRNGEYAGASTYNFRSRVADFVVNEGALSLVTNNLV